MHWLVVSVVLSVALTLLLNVGLRLFPRVGRRVERGVTDYGAGEQPPRRVRVLVPWKAMVVASIALTVLLNLVLWLR